ncbi:DUF4148 domain-containing protein [Paraburkholderia silviterrae]|uniref:DUF4148 domain-containing protein n=1 Tax=Paraburkholderia silviterrae TaxID=2528715 RepID=A0A4R5M8D6_9BURK|nr:DUF4148 domain-containing protein [Paraburkholderia silviterrae]TDG22752.1 DUF4148 domain-containing protein [Paraburkholderia silviterrae]
MKVTLKAIIASAALVALAAPALSFAQSESTVTRAQVLAELVQAGYYPGRANDPHYPDDLQAAEARVARNNAAADSSGYGGAATGTSASGERQPIAAGPAGSIFGHH